VEQHIKPFIGACLNVFKEFLGADLKVGRPYFSETSAVNEWDLSAVIGLTGDARGAVVMSMKKNLALRITNILTGTEHASLDDDVVDAIGEVLNIIAGNAKKGLEESFRLVISLPAIVEGGEHAIRWPNSQARIMRIPFDIFDHDSFNLSVALEAVKKP
jgi:chemotaxis protein CheX